MDTKQLISLLEQTFPKVDVDLLSNPSYQQPFGIDFVDKEGKIITNGPYAGSGTEFVFHEPKAGPFYTCQITGWVLHPPFNSKTKSFYIVLVHDGIIHTSHVFWINATYAKLEEFADLHSIRWCYFDGKKTIGFGNLNEYKKWFKENIQSKTSSS